MIHDARGWAVVDAGRLQRLTPIVRRVALVLLVVRPVAEQLVGATHAVASLRRSIDGNVAVVLAGDGPYRASDVEPTLGSHVVAHLPNDPVTAEHMRDGGGTGARIGRSRLGRAVTALAEQVDDVAADREREAAEVTP
jgi:hypothetical protein